MIVKLIFVRCLVAFFVLKRAHTMILRLPCAMYSDFRIEKSGKRLEGHVLMEKTNTDDVHCTFQCTQDPQCRSYNINKDMRICQLNSKALVDENMVLVDKPGWAYRSTDYNTTLLGPTCEQLNPCPCGILCRDKCDAPFYECIICDKYHYGVLCDKRRDLDECASNPCRNAGKCVDLVADYRCECLAGTTGRNCETDINECASNPCQNGATCNNLNNKFTCTCLPGFSGTKCETDIDWCASNPCSSNGVCVDIVSSFRCDCNSGYYGIPCRCTGTFTANTGSIVSPNYPAKYPNNADCTYQINAPAGKYIKITFQDFQLERPNAYGYFFDWIEVKESISGTNHKREYYGHEMSTKPTCSSCTVCASRSNSLTMKFKTDVDRREKGFKLSYEFIDTRGTLSSCAN